MARVAVDAAKPMHADALPQTIVRRSAPTIATDVLRWAEFDLDRAVWHRQEHFRACRDIGWKSRTTTKRTWIESSSAPRRCQ